MIIVIGAGVAGLTAVKRLASAGADVTLVSAGRFGCDSTSAGNTALAQGGIAVALDHSDRPALHANDTMKAGAGLVTSGVAQLVATDGVQRVRELLAAGFPADRTSTGALAFGLEAAHSRARVVHAGEDSTGAALSAFLTHQIQQYIATGVVQLVDQAHLQQLDTCAGRVTGITVASDSGLRRLKADAVILATGGFAGLYPNTSSSAAVTGQGVLVAARAGAVLADLEFLQFHPTVVPGTGQLISEAVRGAGAVLRDPAGRRFMTPTHPQAELAPRDVVSRTSAQVMDDYSASCVWLDATVIEQRHGSGTLANRFPVLTRALSVLGLDWTREYVPVAPAAHYCMGGIATDTVGHTSVAGLYAAGEVASTGLHGANRLASNSLLEGLVFGARAADAALHDLHHQTWNLTDELTQLVASAAEIPTSSAPSVALPGQNHTLQHLVEAHLGITRDQHGLLSMLTQLDEVCHPMVDLVRMMANAALHRTESRGGHWRADYPTSDPIQANRTGWRLTATTASILARSRPEPTKETFVHVDA